MEGIFGIIALFLPLFTLSMKRKNALARRM
jgi:hypothetical protein